MRKLHALLILSLLPVFAQAEGQHGYFNSKLMIGIGAAYQSADAVLRASAGDLPEVKVDLHDLGMNTEDWSWALEGRWRFKPKWMLIALAYTFDEDGNRTAERDFNFDGKEFKAGASVDTEMSINTYILDVMYSAYRSDNTEILLGGGIHAIDLEASLTGRAFVADLERERTTGSSEILAPLPNLRLQAFHAFNSKLGVGISMGWLSANYDDYDGSFVYVHPRVGYAFAEHWTVTAGYQFVDIDLTHEKSSTRETEFNVDFEGPTVFLNYRF